MSDACIFAAGRIIEYSYGEGSADERAAVEAHFKICGECRKRAAAYKKIISAASAQVDFSDEIWAMQRHEIIRRVRKRKSLLERAAKFAASFFNMKKAAAFILILLFVGAGAGYYRRAKSIERDRVITEKMEMLDNIKIIERLEFYKKMSRMALL